MELTLHVCVLRTNSMPEFTYQTMSPDALPNVWGTQDLQQEEVQLACDFVHLKQIYIVSPAVFSRCWCTQDLQEEELHVARNFAPGGEPKHTRGSSVPLMLQQHWQQQAQKGKKRHKRQEIGVITATVGGHFLKTLTQARSS
jgi:hypothetical protein